jgi:hypothetical protein
MGIAKEIKERRKDGIVDNIERRKNGKMESRERHGKMKTWELPKRSRKEGKMERWNQRWCLRLWLAFFGR